MIIGTVACARNLHLKPYTCRALTSGVMASMDNVALIVKSTSL